MRVPKIDTTFCRDSGSDVEHAVQRFCKKDPTFEGTVLVYRRETRLHYVHKIVPKHGTSKLPNPDIYEFLGIATVKLVEQRVL